MRRMCCNGCAVFGASTNWIDLGSFEVVSGTWLPTAGTMFQTSIYSASSDALLLCKTKAKAGDYGTTIRFQPTNATASALKIVFAGTDESNYYCLQFTDPVRLSQNCGLGVSLVQVSGGSASTVDSQTVISNATYSGCWNIYNGYCSLTWWNGGVIWNNSYNSSAGLLAYAYYGSLGDGKLWGFGTSSANATNTGFNNLHVWKANNIIHTGAYSSAPDYDGLPALASCDASRAVPPFRDTQVPDKLTVSISGSTDKYCTGCCSQFNGTYTLTRNSTSLMGANYAGYFWNYTLPTPITINNYWGGTGVFYVITGLELQVNGIGRATCGWVGHEWANNGTSDWGFGYALELTANVLDDQMTQWNNKQFLSGDGWGGLTVGTWGGGMAGFPAACQGNIYMYVNPVKASMHRASIPQNNLPSGSGCSACGKSQPIPAATDKPTLKVER